MTLRQYLNTRSMEDDDAMNILQDAGAVSDNCVKVDDVAPADHARAIALLEKYPQRARGFSAPGLHDA